MVSMKKILNLGFDFDDVIAYSHETKSKLTYSMFGVNIPPDEFRKDKILGQNILTPEQYTHMGRVLFTQDHDIQPVPDAIETITRLVKEGHIIKIVSSRSKEGQTLEPAQNWMKKYNLNIPIIGTGYGKSKLEAVQDLDLFVDDDPEKLEPLSGIVPHILFYRWPHNSHKIQIGNVVEVWSWKDIYEYISNI